MTIAGIFTKKVTGKFLSYHIVDLRSEGQDTHNAISSPDFDTFRATHPLWLHHRAFCLYL
jgi:hypothetical protein